MVFRSRPGRRRGHARARSGGTAEGFTDEVAELLPVEASGALDASVRALARQIASRLMIPRPRKDARSQRGAGTLASVPYRRGSDEIDLDKTIEMLAERPVPDDEDIIVRERVRTRRALVLVVDASGSMKGERIRTAAAVVGALAGELAREGSYDRGGRADALPLHRPGGIDDQHEGTPRAYALPHDDVLVVGHGTFGEHLDRLVEVDLVGASTVGDAREGSRAALGSSILSRPGNHEARRDLPSERPH